MEGRPVERWSARRLPRAVNFALGLLLLLAVWRMDLATPARVSMAIFYLLPIGYIAWFCGGNWGYAAALLSAGAWLQADLAAQHLVRDPLILYWNAGVRLAFFVTVVVLSGLVSRLRRLIDQEREVSRLKSDMVSLVSHEFGNFLTTFRLCLTLLKESEEGDLRAQRTRCYATLERVYAHLSSAVSNFLNLNRIESGRFEPHLQRTRLRTLIHGVVSQLGPLVENKNIAMKLDLPAVPVPVRADPDALAVVLSNLITNAFKYTPAGGAVTIRVDLSGESAGVSVEDTGIGISKEDLARISSAFYRTEKGRTTAKGFGVGLKVARELLEGQGSRLEISSEPGRGSRFSFRLPLAGAEK